MVDICKSTIDTRHATLVVMVTASGRMFPPFLIFKGRMGCQIEWEFSTFHKDGLYACQKMHVWIGILWRLGWSKLSSWMCPASQMGLFPFFCWTCTTVIWSSQLFPSSKSREWKCCTSQLHGLVPPINVGINKSLKSKSKAVEGLDDGLWLEWTVTVPVTLFDIAEWVIEVYYLPMQIVCNALMKKGYAWFTNNEEVEDRNWGSAHWCW